MLIGIGLAWPLLRRREWRRTARIALVAIAVMAFQYSFYGISALVPLEGGAKWISLPSPWWLVEMAGRVWASARER